MRFAIIGTGFVADYYMTTLANHPGLALTGVWDHDAERLSRFCTHWKLTAYGSREELLADSRAEAVAVLTDPGSHYEIARASMDAGKHVYCEKPLAMRIEDARRLVTLADARRLILAGAPANARSDAFALVRKTLKSGVIGRPRLVYAQIEDGPVFRQDWRQWRSVSGAPWPGAHEFEIGCTLEHAGYALTWLMGLFGPIRQMLGHSGLFFPDKGTDTPPHAMAADFSTACLAMGGGVVARLTCGLAAPRDRSMTIMGEKGALIVDDLWDDRSPVHLERAGQKPQLSRRIGRRWAALAGRQRSAVQHDGRLLAYPRGPRKRLPAYPSRIDFAAGLQAVADCRAGRGTRRERLAAQALHVTEAALALNRLGQMNGHYKMISDL